METPQPFCPLFQCPAVLKRKQFSLTSSQNLFFFFFSSLCLWFFLLSPCTTINSLAPSCQPSAELVPLYQYPVLGGRKTGPVILDVVPIAVVLNTDQFQGFSGVMPSPPLSCLFQPLFKIPEKLIMTALIHSFAA